MPRSMSPTHTCDKKWFLNLKKLSEKGKRIIHSENRISEMLRITTLNKQLVEFKEVICKSQVYVIIPTIDPCLLTQVNPSS